MCLDGGKWCGFTKLRAKNLDKLWKGGMKIISNMLAASWWELKILSSTCSFQISMLAIVWMCLFSYCIEVSWNWLNVVGGGWSSRQVFLALVNLSLPKYSIHHISKIHSNVFLILMDTLDEVKCNLQFFHGFNIVSFNKQIHDKMTIETFCVGIYGYAWCTSSYKCITLI